jgi:hypothetical protein
MEVCLLSVLGVVIFSVISCGLSLVQRSPAECDISK